ncbi:MAG: hypothetical protein R3C26_07970 [Calditrichia bacterium]
MIAQGSSADQAFNNFLKTQYVRDQVSTHSASAVSGGIFDGMGNFFFDDGNHGTYNVDYPDGINPRTGAQLCLKLHRFYAINIWRCRRAMQRHVWKRNGNGASGLSRIPV